MNEPEQLDFFFWLGEGGDATEVSGEVFEAKQEEVRKNLDDFLNVRIRD